MKTIVISTPNDHTRFHNTWRRFGGQTLEVDYECLPAIMNYEQPAVGIMQSFKKAIQTAMDSLEPSVAIFEDDLSFTSPDSLKRFYGLYNDYHVGELGLFLGGFYQGEPKELTNEIARVEGKVSGLHALIVDQKWYGTILEAEEPYNLDHWLSVVKKVPIFAAYPMLVMQQDGLMSYNAKKVMNYTKDLHLKYKIDGK